MFCFLDYDDISNQIDFIICLGGDGTLLYASSLFQVRAPTKRPSVPQGRASSGPVHALGLCCGWRIGQALGLLCLVL